MAHIIHGSAGGGIGGGGVLVPILILVMGFTIKAAIPLSSVTILGYGYPHHCSAYDTYHLQRSLLSHHAQQHASPSCC